MTHDDSLKEQIAYYEARAPEYDEWWERRGRYDRGPAERAAWFREVAQLESALDARRPYGRVLELACGTGLWTERLAAAADSVLAVDASAAALRLNAERLRQAPHLQEKVRYEEADLFAWRPGGTFDLAFFGFWLSHVPPERFEAFWGMVGAVLAPGGRAFLVDSLREPGATARDQTLPDEGGAVVRRRLNDGRTFDIVKVFYTPEDLRARLEPLGWRVTAGRTERFFVHAEAWR